MKKFICLVFAAFTLSALPSVAQKRGAKTKVTQKAPEPTPEELEAQAIAAAREKRIEEMLPGTRLVTFIDSAVVDKDDFLAHLQITTDAGRFTDPQTLFSDREAQYVTGRAAFVNSLSSAVYFSVSDSVGDVRLHAAFRNGGQWSAPQLLEGLEGFHYQDYPFLLSDGITLYFSAVNDESLGGLDLFATRYNNSTRQYVRPENLGFPFNSTANDYLLAIDESAGVGVLVSDRRQPDDKVCIYWFIAQENYPIFDYDEDDDDSVAEARRVAEIASIRQTQGNKAAVEAARRRWKESLADATLHAEKHLRFIINDDTVLSSLDQFKSTEARETANRWAEMSEQLEELSAQLEGLRGDYAQTRSQKAAQQIRNLEAQVQQLRNDVTKLAKAYRQQENSARNQ